MPIKKSIHRRAAIAAVLAAAAVWLLPSGQSDRGSGFGQEELALQGQTPATGRSSAIESRIAEPIVEFSIEDFCESTAVEDWTNNMLAQSGDSMEEFRRMQADTAARLSISRDPEHLHTAALLEADLARKVEASTGARAADPDSSAKHSARQIALISRALDADPGNPLHLWGAVQICMTASAEWNENRTDCPLEAWQARLLEADPQNREVWAYAAVNLLAAGNESDALKAMQKAGALTESRVYWPETVEMLERGLAAGTDWPFMGRATEAIGVAGRNLFNELRPMGLCRDQSEVSQDWAYACLAYGRQDELNPPVELARSPAIAIQQYALTALGDEEGLAQLNARWRQQRERRSEIYEEIGSRIVAAVANPTLFARYLQLVGERGEIEAQIALNREAQAWVQRHQGAECIP